MLPGGTAQETIQLNLDSLWSGGPFQDAVRATVLEVYDINYHVLARKIYNGGNNQPEEQDAMAVEMQRIRQVIFNSSNGEIASTSLSSDLVLVQMSDGLRRY